MSAQILHGDQKNTATAGCSLRLRFSGGTLLLEGPAAAVQRNFHPSLWLRDARVEAWRCDAIEYAAVSRRFLEKRIAVEDSVGQWGPVRWPRTALRPLRPEQQAAVAAWNASRRGVIVMPTGTGKTEVALEIMRLTSVATLIVCPVRDLMYQWHRRILDAFGVDAGIIGDSRHVVRPVSVTTYDSARIHMDKLGDRFGLLIFDECHHLPSVSRRDAARMSAAPLRLGLTATPERNDGLTKDLDVLIGSRVYELPLADVCGRTLADYVVVRIPVHLNDCEQAFYDRLSSEVRAYVRDRRATDPKFRWEDVCEEANTSPEARRALRAFRAKQSIADRSKEKLRVLEDLFRLHAGTPCVVFTGSNAMARDVARRFLIPCLLNHCRKRERHDYLRGLEEGTYPAIVANQVLDEGVDLPAVKVAIVVGGTTSTKQAVQRLGRILRRTGHARATLYEVVCAETNEEQRSRRRRASDAFQGTRHRRL
jgi:superfamily II DNA or RNA helicase